MVKARTCKQGGGGDVQRTCMLFVIPRGGLASHTGSGGRKRLFDGRQSKRELLVWRRELGLGIAKTTENGAISAYVDLVNNR